MGGRAGLTRLPLRGEPTRIAIFPEGPTWVSSSRRMDLLREQGSSKNLASFRDGKVNVFLETQGYDPHPPKPSA